MVSRQQKNLSQFGPKMTLAEISEVLPLFLHIFGENFVVDIMFRYELNRTKTHDRSLILQNLMGVGKSSRSPDDLMNLRISSWMVIIS